MIEKRGAVLRQNWVQSWVAAIATCAIQLFAKTRWSWLRTFITVFAFAFGLMLLMGLARRTIG